MILVDPFQLRRFCESVNYTSQALSRERVFFTYLQYQKVHDCFEGEIPVSIQQNMSSPTKINIKTHLV